MRQDASAPAFPLPLWQQRVERDIDWLQLSLVRGTAAVLPTFHHDCATHLRRQRAQPMKQLDVEYLDLNYVRSRLSIPTISIPSEAPAVRSVVRHSSRL